MKKKTLIITGTTNGIGKAIVQRLKGEFYIIAINRRNDNCVDENIICDLSNIDAVVSLCNDLSQYKVDVLINNAGGSYPCTFTDISFDNAISDINLNFVSPMLLMQSIIKGMLVQGYGNIVNISSISSKAPTPYLHIYSAAKSALDSLTKSCAIAYGNNNITINSVCPGAVDTAMSIEGRKRLSKFHGLSEDRYQQLMIEGAGIGRMIHCEEVAHLVSFLISEETRAISGQSINICGTLEVN